VRGRGRGRTWRWDFSQGGGDAETIGDLFEGEEEPKGGATDGSSVGEVIEFAAKETTEGIDARGGPGGEVGEGADLDLAVFAEALAEEGGGVGAAVGDDGDVHAHIIQQIFIIMVLIITYT